MLRISNLVPSYTLADQNGHVDDEVNTEIQWHIPQLFTQIIITVSVINTLFFWSRSRGGGGGRSRWNFMNNMMFVKIFQISIRIVMVMIVIENERWIIFCSSSTRTCYIWRRWTVVM